MKYVCPVCGYIYDEAAQKVPFAELPDTWVCPLCGAEKALFAPERKAEAKCAPKAASADVEMRRLGAAELSVVCSNLARGCEKQYKREASEKWRALADYFASAAEPDAQADIDTLAALLKRDLDENYDTLRETAKACADRGTQRVCAWGEKVTTILSSLAERYRREGDRLLEGKEIWVCTVCGFVYIGASAPEKCPVCKVPSWKFEKIEGRNRA